MALKDVRIQELINKQTVSIIQSSDFKVLEQCIIDRKPLTAVVSAIDTILSDEIKRDKDTYQELVTKEVCKKQIEADQAFEKNDPQEEINDNELKEKLTKKHCTLKDELDSFSKTLASQQQKFAIANARNIFLKGQVEETERKLQNISTELDVIHRDYPDLAKLPPFYRYKLSSLSADSERIKLQLSEFNKQSISTLAHEESTWNNVKKHHTEMESEFNNLIRELTTEIPHRKKVRAERASELVKRKNARLNNDPDLKQLSLESRTQRDLKITQVNQQLDDGRKQLMSIVNSSSYHVFIAELQIKLDKPSGLSITAQEIEKLKSTINDTARLEMERQEAELRKLCKEIQTKLTYQQHCLQTAQEKRARYNQSNTELVAKNNQLDLQRINLRKQAVSYRTTSNKYFTTAVIAFFITLAIILFVTLMALNPLFFIIPGVFGLATLGTFIGGVFYDIKVESNFKQAKMYDQQFAANIKQTDNQVTGIKTIDTEIPILQEQISESTKDLDQANKNLTKHQKKMHGTKAKADTAMSGQPSQAGMFAAPVTGEPANANHGATTNKDVASEASQSITI